MRGVPAILQTRADYERVCELVCDPESGLPHQDRERGLRQWRALLSHHRWEFDQVIASHDEAADDEDHRVVEVRDEDSDELLELRQEARVDNPGARIYRLGFSVAEVEQAITDMEGAING